MDQFAIGTTGAIGDTPAKSFQGTREDLADAIPVLKANHSFRRWSGINETTGFDDGEKPPADLGFFLGSKFNRDDTSGKGTVEQSPETFAHAGGIDDDVLGRTLLGEVLDLTKYGEVVLTGPGMTSEDAVGGMVEFGEGGEIDGDDGEGGGVTTGIAETLIGEGGGEAGFGFVHAGDVDEEGNWGCTCFLSSPTRALPKYSVFGEGCLILDGNIKAIRAGVNMPDWASMVSQKYWVRTRGWLRPRSAMTRSTWSPYLWLTRRTSSAV